MSGMRRSAPASALRVYDGQPLLPRARIILVSASSLFALACSTWSIAQVFAYRIPQRALALATAFISIQSLMIAVQLGISVSVKKCRQRAQALAQTIQPVVRDHAAAHAAGDDRLSPLAALAGRHRDQVEIGLIEVLTAIQGDGRRRVALLADQLGFVALWRAQASSYRGDRRRVAIERLGKLGRSDLRPVFETALADPDLLIRATACRSLLELPDPANAGDMFRLAVEGPLLLRAVLAGELRRHSLSLRHHGVPECLAGGQTGEILAGLSLIEAWGRALSIPQIASLMIDRSVAVRAAAVRALSFVDCGWDTEFLILAALDDPAPQVRLAALNTCSRRALASALPSLERRLRERTPEIVAAACEALGSLGKEGARVLDRCILDPDRFLAMKATEALARVSTAAPVRVQAT